MAHFFRLNTFHFFNLGWERPNTRRFRWSSLYFRLLTIAHKSRILFFLSQISLIFLVCLVFSLIPFILEHMLITRKNSPSLNLCLATLIILVDIYSLLFLRTRTSIKYFPVCFFLLLYAFLLYVNCNPYSFDFISLYAVSGLSVFLMGFFLKFAEYPALEAWPPEDPNTPKPRTPRMMFNPVFSMAWINDAPPMWTIFMPPFGRGFFERRHLAFVNNDAGALAAYRGEGEGDNGESNLFSFEERHLVNRAGFAGEDIRYRL